MLKLRPVHCHRGRARRGLAATLAVRAVRRRADGLQGRLDADRRSVHVPRRQDQHDPGRDGRSHHRDRRRRRLQGRRAGHTVLRADSFAHEQQDRHHLGGDADHRCAQGSDRFLRPGVPVPRGHGRQRRRRHAVQGPRRPQGRDGRRAGRHGLRRLPEEERRVRRGQDLRFARRRAARREPRPHQGRLRRRARSSPTSSRRTRTSRRSSSRPTSRRWPAAWASACARPTRSS